MHISDTTSLPVSYYTTNLFHVVKCFQESDNQVDSEFNVSAIYQC